LLEKFLILEHVSHSGGNGHFLPGLEGIFGVLDCCIELILGGLGNLSD
jgi:hypothetical protein